MKTRSNLIPGFLLCATMMLVGGLHAQTPGFHTSTITSNGVINVDSHVTYYDGSDGTLFAAMALPPGATALQFRVTGGIVTDISDNLASADGLYANGATPYNWTDTSWEGTYKGVPIGATTGVDPALFGVFFSYSFSGTASNSANYRSDSGIVPDPRTLLSYAPLLNQPFYIGDGYNSNNAFSSISDGYVPPGTVQTFNIPVGATHLLLGIGTDPDLADNRDAATNLMAFAAHIFDNSPSVPEIISVSGGNVAYAGLPWSFNALVGGSQPLTFQWSLNGSNLTDQARIFGCRSNVLAFTNVVASDAGTYQLMASNALGVAAWNIPLTVLALPALTNNNYASTIINTSNLLAYWRFDPFYQTNSCVNGYTGTLHGNAQLGAEASGCPLAPDPANQALLLDGSSGYLATSLTGQIGNQGSMLAWVYLTEQPASVGHIFSIVAQSQNGNDFDFQIETDNGTKFYAGSGSCAVYAQALPLNQWHFLAATLAANSTRSIYLDGQLVASATGGGHSTNSNPVWIGNNLVFGPRYFQGRIDEVAIYNRALTGAEIAAIYSSASVPALQLAPLNKTVVMTWPTNFGGYALQTNGSLNPANWATFTTNYGILATNYVITNAVGSEQLYFRLSK